MLKIFPFQSPDKKYKIDFSLIPVGILLLELSILSTELTLRIYPHEFDIFLIRFTHALLLLAFSYLLSRYSVKRNKLYFSYLELATPATIIVVAGVFGSNLLSHALNVEPLNTYRAIASGLIQSLFWFPFFVLAGSQRTEIFAQFKEYEKRLIISTRAKSRASEKFQENQRKIQHRIRFELTELCDCLRNSITELDVRNLALPEANNALQKQLKGDELRKLSMKLETYSSERENTSFLGQNLKSFRLLITQFRILHAVTAQKAPLKASTYALILIILITPAHINYFTAKEAAISYPLLCIAIIGFTKLITKSLATDSPNRIRNSSILIYTTGLIPLVANRIGQSITHDPNTSLS